MVGSRFSIPRNNPYIERILKITKYCIKKKREKGKGSTFSFFFFLFCFKLLSVDESGDCVQIKVPDDVLCFWYNQHTSVTKYFTKWLTWSQVAQVPAPPPPPEPYKVAKDPTNTRTVLKNLRRIRRADMGNFCKHKSFASTYWPCDKKYH